MATDTAEPEPRLFTLDQLGVTVPDDVDVQAIAKEWLAAFSQHVSSSNIAGILSLFVEDGWWRDELAFTWDFRSFHGSAKIKKFLDDRLSITKPSAFTFTQAQLEKPFPDIAWILVLLDFETDVGLANAVLRLIPQPDGVWKASMLTTSLHGLKAFPEQLGALRSKVQNHGDWRAQREQEIQFRDSDPKVLIVGAGHSGLQLAARLKSLGIPTLNVEKQARIGDSWRQRYDALTLHDPVWMNHMAYIPFPPQWPQYMPAHKLANWLEFYADALDLNVWTSSTVVSTEQQADNTWIVTVRLADGTERKLHVQQVVLALGWEGAARWPKIPGKEEFKGTVMHSSMFKNGKGFAGKNVVVVGTCTSGHDIAEDCLKAGANVTMVQRNPICFMTTTGLLMALGVLYCEAGTVPIETADRLMHAMPFTVMKFLWQRLTTILGDVIDKPTLDALNKVGFKTTRGPEGCGLPYLARTRGGGFYQNVGTSELIIEGKIKLKSDSTIERLTEDGVKFEDGSVLSADVVVYATGFEPPHTKIAAVCGEAIAKKVGPLWDVDEEGEQRNVWRYAGVPNLHYMIGNILWSRYHSKHVALQIAAQLGGQFTSRYSLRTD